MNRNAWLGCVLLAGAATMTAGAMDVGDPLYSGDMAGNARIEFVYENYQREAILKFDDTRIVKTSAQGKETIVEIPDIDSSNETDLFMARLSVFAPEVLTLTFDAGIVDDPAGAETGYLIGAGVNVLLLESGCFRLSAVGAAHYVPSYDAESTITDDVIGAGEADGEIEYWEAGGGLMASLAFAPTPQLQLVPYVGGLASVLRGSVDQTVEFADGGSGSTEVDIEEEDVGVLVVGGSVVINQTCSIRAEGRLIGDESGSVALGCAF